MRPVYIYCLFQEKCSKSYSHVCCILSQIYSSYDKIKRSILYLHHETRYLSQCNPIFEYWSSSIVQWYPPRHMEHSSTNTLNSDAKWLTRSCIRNNISFYSILYVSSCSACSYMYVLISSYAFLWRKCELPKLIGKNWQGKKVEVYNKIWTRSIPSHTQELA